MIHNLLTQSGHLFLSFFTLSLLSLTSLAAPDSALSAESAPAVEKKLIRMVVLSRHGLRAPIFAQEKQNTLAQKPWPQWPVAPGELTPRGAELVRAQWGLLRPEVAALGLLPQKGCPDPRELQAWSCLDKDGRTAATAQALLDGLAPNCGLTARSEKSISQVFHPVGAGLAAYDEAKVQEELASARKKLNIDEPMALLNEITGGLAPQWCGRVSGDCRVQDIPDMKGFYLLAYEIIEDFLLEYAQWPDKTPGWGKVDTAMLKRLLPALNTSFTAGFGAHAVAAPSNSALTDAVRDALLDEKAPRFLALVGHDSNIIGLASLLGLSWTVPDQGVNAMPPACALVFSLWEDKDGKREVSARMYAAPLEALRAARAEAGPAPYALEVPIEACGPRCTPEAFARLVDAKILPDALAEYSSYARHQ